MMAFCVAASSARVNVYAKSTRAETAANRAKRFIENPPFGLLERVRALFARVTSAARWLCAKWIWVKQINERGGGSSMDSRDRWCGQRQGQKAGMSRIVEHADR